MWQVEVDYGKGWQPYGPPYPDKTAARHLERDLARHGHGARIVPATAVVAEMPVATKSHPVSERKRRRRRR